MKIPILSNWIIKKRIKYASKCGRLEHKAGRLILIPILTSIITAYYHYWAITLIATVLTLICWIIYILSHTFEKKLYGHHGFR